jgi:hypothetical protein
MASSPPIDLTHALRLKLPLFSLPADDLRLALACGCIDPIRDEKHGRPLVRILHLARFRRWCRSGVCHARSECDWIYVSRLRVRVGV